MFKVNDRVAINLKACIFPDDGGPSIMASKGTKGIVKKVPNNNSFNFTVLFNIDGKGYWSTFSFHELDLIKDGA